jgi:integrase
LKKLFTRARNVWGIRFNQMPNWKEHMLREPEERVRELRDGEEQRIMRAMRDDYSPLIEFARMTGLRAAEVRTLEWSHVNWGTRQIVRLGKGGRRVSTPITDELRKLLWPLQGHHERYVFTYTCKRTKLPNLIRGQRYPVTKEGLKTAWRRLRAKAGIAGRDGFRFHDWRHDLATKTLRETGNLKLVQRMLNHSKITTIVKYAHVVDDEVAAALQARAQGRVRKADLPTTASPQTGPLNETCASSNSIQTNEKSA